MSASNVNISGNVRFKELADACDKSIVDPVVSDPPSCATSLAI